ncbi:MAG: radical SAM protein [archaeon]|nr:radical SAM protein [archaeon]
MKVLLIRERNLAHDQSSLSYGLGLIGTLIKDISETSILDNNSHYKLYSIKEILIYIKNFKPDIIGFNITTFNFLASKKLISVISKLFPEKCLLAGGIHTYVAPMEVADLGVHIVAKDDADLTIIPLLKALESHVAYREKFTIMDQLGKKLKDIPGIIFKMESTGKYEDTGQPLYLKDLDSLPFLDYNLFNLKDYIKNDRDKQRILNSLLTQRGCPFSCSFCMINPKGGIGIFRQNSSKYRVENIKFLHNKYGIKHFNFYDSNFIINKKLTIDFCNNIVKSGLHKKITFFGQTNVVNKFDDDLLHSLKMAGCIGIGLGIERLSKVALNRIRKNEDYVTIRKNIDIIKKYNINITANCLIGFPFETVETVKEEKQLYTEILNDIKTFSVYTLVPMPGTKVYKETKYQNWYKNEMIMKRKPSLYSLIFDYTNHAANWNINWYDFDTETQKAIREFKEYFLDINIKKMDSRIIEFLHYLEKFVAKLSYKLHKISPRIESFLFYILKYFYQIFKNYFVIKFRTEKSIN